MKPSARMELLRKVREHSGDVVDAAAEVLSRRDTDITPKVSISAPELAVRYTAFYEMRMFEVVVWAHCETDHETLEHRVTGWSWGAAEVNEDGDADFQCLVGGSSLFEFLPTAAIALSAAVAELQEAATADDPLPERWEYERGSQTSGPLITRIPFF